MTSETSVIYQTNGAASLCVAPFTAVRQFHSVPTVSAVWPELLLPVREVSGLRLGPESGHPVKIFLLSRQIPGYGLVLSHGLFFQHPFRFIYSQITLSYASYGYRVNSLNKPRINEIRLRPDRSVYAVWSLMAADHGGVQMLHLLIIKCLIGLFN
jgi:hypothetical protein